MALSSDHCRMIMPNFSTYQFWVFLFKFLFFDKFKHSTYFKLTEVLEI